jgi:transcriptional regulator GlxA family with amidase domain
MAKKDVALVIHQGVQVLDLAGPLDVFTEANAFVAQEDGYRCFVVAETTAPVRASSGVLLVPHLGYAANARSFHTVLVAGGPELPDRPADAALSEWLRQQSARAERIGSICTGAFALGHAGLLDGKVATTHWQNAARLAEAFPSARIELDRIYSRDGTLVTSAGVTAGIDLALALVKEDYGTAVATACGKRLVVATVRQGGQSQFSPLLLPIADTTPLGKIQEYVMNHLAEPYPVERLAELAGVSPRSVARLFLKEVRLTPHQFIESIRIDHARKLLEGTDSAIKAVAFASGFATPEHMRTAFQRKLGVSPAEYRGNFRRGLARH